MVWDGWMVVVVLDTLEVGFSMGGDDVRGVRRFRESIFWGMGGVRGVRGEG